MLGIPRFNGKLSERMPHRSARVLGRVVPNSSRVSLITQYLSTFWAVTTSAYTVSMGCGCSRSLCSKTLWASWSRSAGVILEMVAASEGAVDDKLTMASRRFAMRLKTRSSTVIDIANDFVGH